MYTIYLGSNLIYDTANKDSYPLSEENLKLPLRNSGSLEFKVYPDHPYYADLKLPYRYVTVYRDAEEIFYGRTLRYTSDLNGVLQVSCEGALTFLQDADMEKLDKTTETVSAFFSRCINAYNSKVENAKKFTIGDVTIDKANSNETFEITRYQKINDVLNNQLVNRFGGFLRVRPNSNGPHFIDYLSSSDVIGSTNPQLIKIAKNILNRENKVTGEKVFTVLRPIGEKDTSVQGLRDEDVQIQNCEIHGDVLYLTDLIDNYGKIFETVNFPNVTDKTKLLRDAENYITKIRGHLPSSLEINYVDWHYMNPQTPYVSLGDAFTNLEGYSGQTMIVSEMSLNLEDASKDTAIFENIESLEENNNRNRGLGGSSSGKGSFSGYAGQQWKYYSEALDGVTQIARINADEIDIIAGENLRLAGQVTEITSSGKMLLQVQESGQGGMLRLGVLDSIINEHQSYTISGVSLDNPTKTIHLDEIAEIKGADIWIDRNRVTTVAGQFLVENDPLHADAKFVKLIEGSTLQVKDNGVFSAVASEGRVNTLFTQTNDAITAEVSRATGAEASLQLTANSLTNKIQTAEGNISTLQNTANGLTLSITSLNNTKATVYRQWADPVNTFPAGRIHDGDIWIQDNGVRLWGEANLWSDYGTQQWRDYYGSKLKVRWNGRWVLQNDAPAISEHDTQIEQTKEKVSIIARERAADAINLAELKVTSREISATVTSVQADQTTLNGKLTIEAGKILQIVSSVGADGTVTAASIVTAINHSGSSVIISADHINLTTVNNRIDEKPTVYRQWADPVNTFPAGRIHDGDIWIQDNGVRLWGEANLWSDYGTQQWRDYYGSKLKVRWNGRWVLQNDAPAILENGTEIDQTKEKVAIIAREREVFASNIAELKVTSREISATVTRVQADQSTMSGRLTVEAERISQIVEHVGADGTVTAASIVLAVNNSGSSILLDADKIRLTGQITLDSKLGIDDHGYILLKGTTIVNGPLDVINSNDISARNFVVGTGGYIRMIGGQSGEFYDVTSTILSGMIKSFSVSGNTLTLTPFHGDPVNFSKATTLSGAWSGNPAQYVVTASPQNEHFYYDPPMRLNGTTQYSNFSAEIYDTPGGGTPQMRKQIYGHLDIVYAGGQYNVDVIPGEIGESNTAVARLSVDSVYVAGGYAGRAAVGLADPTADSRVTLNETRTFTISTTGRTNSSGTVANLEKTVPLHLYADDWNQNSNKANVYLKWGSTAGSSGTNYAKLEVDASSLVTNAGYAGRSAVTLNDPTADSRVTLNESRTFTVSTTGRTNSSGTVANLEKTVPLHLYADDWNQNSNKANVYLKWGSTAGSSGTNYAKLEVDASSLVTSAGYAGRAAVGLDDPVWNAVTGATPDHRTVTVNTTHRTNSSGTVDNLSASVSLYLVQGNWNSSQLSVSLKSGSTTGSEVAKTTISAPLQSKTVNSNGTVSPDSGYIGLSSVSINVPSGDGCTVDLYPNGQNDIGTSAQLPEGATNLGTLASAINGAVGRRIYVWFYAGVKAPDSSIVSGSRKLYALAIN